ncbi:MAG: hypothetical protein DMG37_03260 [Acidobacteria bacterium]|nr:MAG: hypothetical protein DMG37_03260 [Acidobacteriota bacterium]
MKTIQIVLDKKLLVATDRAARRAKRNRSGFVRDALREHLGRLDVCDKETRDRQGYAEQTKTPNESDHWETDAAWPEE